jgi:glycosyltransferase involved in cell wall biosynthesis
MLRRVKSSLDILALEPWLGGSHAVFLESWARRSRHRLRIEGLKARHWRWRMRAGAWELARRIKDQEPPDALFVSDYVDLPSLFGFLPETWSRVPALLYFHENQLTYPGQEGEEEPDFHLGFTNILSCVRADAVIFNSKWHREDFQRAAVELLAQLPKPNPRVELLARLEEAAVISPGVDTESIPLGSGGEGPLRVAFNHRWEHDKDPRTFLSACSEAIRAGSELELVLLGERFASTPPGLESLLEELAPHLVHEGYAPDRATYAALLGASDIVASTALHEFFGMAVAEGLAAGCTPLVPNRLAYPEVLGAELSSHLYEDGELTSRLIEHAREPGELRKEPTRALMRGRATCWGAASTSERLDELTEAIQSDP